MVKKILQFFNSELESINQAALLLAFFSLLSQVLGLLRDRSLAHFIGPSSGLDAYYAAFRIPDFIFVAVASFASVTILIPFLVSSGEEKKGMISTENARFLNQFLSAFFLAITLVSVAAFFAMPLLAPLVAPGFSAAELASLVSLSRVLLLSPILLGLSNLFGTVTQLFKKFAIYALGPILYNAGIIVGVLVLYPLWGITGVALGVILGALLHFGIQIPVVLRHGWRPRLTRDIDFPKIRDVALKSLPRTAGLSINALTILVITAIASTLREGSISIFNFSYHLQAVPLGIIGMSYAVAAFPTLTELYSKNNRESFFSHIHTGVRQILFWSFPIMALFIVLRAQIVRVILGTGSFSWTHTRLTAAVLAVFCISIFAQSLVLLFVRGYYAAGNTKRPLLINFASALLTVFLSFAFLTLFRELPSVRYFLESLFRIRGVPGSDILSLPLAYSLGSILNVFLLVFFFKKDFLRENEAFPLAKPFWQSMAVAALMGGVAYAGLLAFGMLFDLDTFLGILAQGLFAGIAAIICGVAFFLFLGNKEIKELKDTLVRRVRGRKLEELSAAPEQEDLQV